MTAVVVQRCDSDLVELVCCKIARVYGDNRHGYISLCCLWSLGKELGAAGLQRLWFTRRSPIILRLYECCFGFTIPCQYVPPSLSFFLSPSLYLSFSFILSFSLPIPSPSSSPSPFLSYFPLYPPLHVFVCSCACICVYDKLVAPATTLVGTFFRSTPPLLFLTDVDFRFC